MQQDSLATGLVQTGASQIAERHAGLELAIVVPCYNERPNVPVLVEKLSDALASVSWEVVFVDDNSPDGTADEARAMGARDPRVRCLRRIGRRGLSSAVIEGALSTSARFIVVMDGDLQHDETRLVVMLDLLRRGGADLVVGSRHVEGGNSEGLSSRYRHVLSATGIRLAQRMLPVPLSDPMSGFFAVPRQLFETLAPRLNGRGFKILLDLALASRTPLRVLEVPFQFRERVAGQSKLDPLVLVQFAGLLIDKKLHGVVPPRFLAFALVGVIGVVVDLGVMAGFRELGLHFGPAQTVGTLVAMIANFLLNNSLTYRNERLRGVRFLRGLVLFMIVCGFGAIANVGIARSLYAGRSGLLLAGTAGSLIGVVWNYAVSATLVWQSR